MKQLIIIFLLYLAGCTSPEQTVLYVSPAGSDSNAGTLAAPYLTLRAALNQVASSRPGKVSIRLMEGAYLLARPIIITPDLLESHPLEITSHNGGRVRMAGTQKIAPEWKPWRGNVLQAVAGKDLPVGQLYLNGKALTLARYPNLDTTQRIFNGTAADAISKERVKTWNNPEGGYVHALHQGMWGGFHYRITGKDDEGNLKLEGGWQNNRPSPMHEQYRFAENIFEELDAPGEWYYNKERGILYLYPPKETDLRTARFERSALNTLFELKGTEQAPLENVTIDGIFLTGTNRTFMLTKEPLLRSDWRIYRGGAVLIEGGRNISISNCTFSELGGNAIFISNYNRDVKITGNHIHHTGAGAIALVGSPDAVRSPSFQYGEFVPAYEIDTIPGPKTGEYPADCLVENNLIHHIGLIEKQVAGVEISMSSSITVRHNTIYEVPRAGINIGDGTWGGHLIEYNDVFATVLETSDHGAFNSWGRDRFWHPDRKTMDSLVKVHPGWVKLDAIEPTVIRNNRFRCDHGWDIDLDDGSTNYLIYNNLCLSGGIKLREGFYRTVYNNILVNNGFHPHVWFEESHDVFRQNIVMDRHRDILLQGWGDTVDHNFFADSADLRYSLARGIDSSSLAGDPLFVDPAKGDFSVKAGSAALKTGFRNFPMDQFGVSSSNLKAMAESPEIPSLIFVNTRETGASLQWQGATLKNVESLAERSAAGLSETSGVLVLHVAQGSAAAGSGLQKGDVILQCDDNPVPDLTALLKAARGNRWKGRHSLTIYRDQAKKELVLKLK